MGISRSLVILVEDYYIRTIPSDWPIVDLGNVAEIKGGKRTPKGEGVLDEETPYHYIRVIDFTDGSVDESRVKFLRKETYKKLSNYTITTEDVYISIAGTIGLSGTIPPSLNNSILTENAAKITNLSNVDKQFLAYFLNSDLGRKQIKIRTGTTSQPKLALDRIRTLRIPLPPLREQQKIAEILTTADDAIQKVNEQITLTEQLKKGLMQRLLTRGIGHTKFKETEIGEIPEEWDLKPFCEVLEIRKKKKLAEVDALYAIPMELIPDENTYCEYKSLKEGEVIPPTYCEPGDILLPKITPSVENGKLGIVPNIPSGHAFATSEVYPIVSENSLTNLFTFYLLKTNLFRKPLIDSMVGTTGRQRVPKDSLFSLAFPVPPISEQNKITEILSSIDDKLTLLSKKRENLETIKQGLMGDLLTGKVRVKV